MYYRNEFRSFSQKDEYVYREELIKKIKSTIDLAKKEYILNVDEEKYITYLEEEYTLLPLEIDKESEHIAEPIIKNEQRSSREWGGSYNVDVYYFKISYSYTGSKELFSISPSSKTITSHNICLESDNTVSFVIHLTQLEEKLSQIDNIQLTRESVKASSPSLNLSAMVLKNDLNLDT